MDIKTEYNLHKPQTDARIIRADFKHPLNLKESDIIKALIIDIKGPNITVRLESGLEFTALLAGGVHLRIGDTAVFTVQGVTSGPLTLEAAVPDMDGRLKIMADALLQAGLKVNDENLGLVSLLIKNQIAVNNDTLTQLNQAMKLFSNDAEKALFLLTNAERVTPGAAAALDNVTGGFKIAAQIETIIDVIMDIKDNAVRQSVVEAFAGIRAALNVRNASTAPAAPGMLPESGRMLNPASPPNDINDINAPAALANRQTGGIITPPSGGPPVLTNSNTPAAVIPAVETAPAAIGGARPDTIRILTPVNENEAENVALNARLARLIINLNDTGANRAQIRAELKQVLINRFLIKPRQVSANEFIKTISALKETAERVSKLPPSSEPRLASEIKTLADTLSFITNLKEHIYVQIPLMLNDRPATGELYVYKNKKFRNARDASSALLSIDTAYLNKFEVYITKDKRNVACQFRLAGDDIIETVKNNIGLLNDELGKSNLSLSGYSFKTQTEGFSLLNHELPNTETAPAEPSGFVFDARA